MAAVVSIVVVRRSVANDNGSGRPLPCPLACVSGCEDGNWHRGGGGMSEKMGLQRRQQM